MKEIIEQFNKMQIVNSFPPNYLFIKLAFPLCEERKAVFCYGDTIYNPFMVEINDNLKIHESVHALQQNDKPELWWTKYINDSEFRLEQEVEAYGTQYAFIKQNSNTKLSDWVKEQLAKALSSGLYGDVISYQEAESKIRNYAKHLHQNNKM